MLRFQGLGLSSRVPQRDGACGWKLKLWDMAVGRGATVSRAQGVNFCCSPLRFPVFCRCFPMAKSTWTPEVKGLKRLISWDREQGREGWYRHVSSLTPPPPATVASRTALPVHLAVFLLPHRGQS